MSISNYRAKWLAITLLTFTTVWAQGQTQSAPAGRPGSIQGKVFDERGFVLVGAAVAVTDANDVSRVAVTGDDGSFSVPNLLPGIYGVRASSKGFETETKMAEVSTGSEQPVEVSFILKIAVDRQEVTVTSDSRTLSLQADENAGALVIKGDDLDALPDDPDELADALQALAGPSAGPDGAQFYIDGFRGGRLPSKASIREIRINQNPFSAEFERLGFGRIEILTRPGTDSFRGEGYFNFNDEVLNSRHPYAPTRAPFQARSFGGNISGPLVAKKASFFLDFGRRELDENAVINARVLDGELNPTSFSETLVTPQRRMSISPRMEYQINEKHTLIGRYEFERTSDRNDGVGGFSLQSQAYDSTRLSHGVRLTETAVVNARLINETRLRYEFQRRTREGNNLVPALRVLDSFNGGGSQVGLSSNESREWEAQNTTSWAAGRHALKAGAQLRNRSLSDITRSNFGGTFIFGGGPGPELDEYYQPVASNDGQPILLQLSSLERYRRTILLQSLGRTQQEIRALGGGPTQFTISGGDPLADITQLELALFLNDDWRLRPDFLVSFGIRYETQTNISDHFDLAPRLSFAWSPGAKPGSRPQTVVRGGFGLFYDRISENIVMDAERYNGISQLQFVVPNPDFFPIVPSIDQLSAAARPQAIRRLADALNAAYSMQGAISVERQLPKGFTVSTSYVRTRRVHDLRSVNINAPLPGTGLRPLGDIGNIFEYQSDGISNQNQVVVGVSNRFSPRFTVFSNYALGKWETNAESGSGSPLDPYDFTQEYGRASFDVRHRAVIGGSITLPSDIRLSPFVIATSGRPFNITTGRDDNGDTLFTERPAFATDPNAPGVIATRLGLFDTTPEPGQQIIPRNYGEGPGFLMTRLRLSKSIGFGTVKEPTETAGPEGPGGPPGGMWAGGGGGRGPGGPGGGRGGRGFGGGGGRVPGKRYSLTLSVDVSNVLNHTNQGQTIGNLTSPLFGLSNSSMSGFGFRGGGGGMSAAGNRRVELQMRFSF
jgi:hypothetical protein